MLSRQAEAVLLERDGGGAPEVSLDGQTRWYRTGTSGNWGRLRQETGLFAVQSSSLGLFYLQYAGRWAVHLRNVG